jgi:hypothetical protein
VPKATPRPSDKDNLIVLDDSPPHHAPFRNMGLHLNGVKQRIAEVMQKEREKLGRVIGGEVPPSTRPVPIGVPRPGGQILDEDAGS